MSDPRLMSIKELKTNIITFIGENGLKSKNFLEKSQLIDFLVEQQAMVLAKKSGIHIIPPGKYILGDPCFITTDLLDLEMFNDTYYEKDEIVTDKNKYQKDQKTKTKSEQLKDEENNLPRFNANTIVTAFNIYNTDSGPMWFTDNNKKYSFLINGGAIVLVPLSYNVRFEQDYIDGKVTEAHVIEFHTETKCFTKTGSGLLHFGDIIINTKKTGRCLLDADGKGNEKKKRKIDEYEDDSEGDSDSEEEEWPR